MARMFDANNVLEHLKQAEKEMMVVTALGCKAVDIKAVIQYIESIPTVDAVEVVHGRWDIDKSFMPFISTCSKCGACYDVDGAFDWNYCPNCGAKMDGDGNG